jgi:hypothetical protein
VEQLRARREARLVSESEGGILRQLTHGSNTPAAAPVTLEQGPDTAITSSAV